MFTSNDFDILRKFVSYAELASQSGGLTSSAFENKSGSFLSILLCEQDDVYTVLRSVNTLSRALASLTRLVEEGLSSSRRQLLPRVYNKGLYTLPFEIVAYIFELSQHGLEYYRRSRNLLKVNRYFRDIATKIPTLWTTVDIYGDPSLALQRTGSKGLVVNFSSIDDSSKPERYLRVLEHHIWRWQSLQLLAGGEEHKDVDDPSSDEGLFLKQLRMLKGKTFLSLEHLEVSYEDEYDFNWGDDDDIISVFGEPLAHAVQNRTTPARSFFREWNMPALRSFTAIGFIPMIPMINQASLTSFKLESGGETNIGGWDLKVISQILSSLSSLESLSLQFRNIDSWRNGEGAQIEIPSLRRLDLGLDTCEQDPTLQLINALSTPNIKEMILLLQYYIHVEINNILEVLFPGPDIDPRWPVLEMFSCGFKPGTVDIFPNRSIENLPYPLNGMFSRLPPLHHLHINAHNMYPPIGLGLHRFFCEDPRHSPAPPLRTLRLSGCNYFDTKFIIGLEKIIMAPEFEKLEIVNCPNINIESMRKLMPIGKELQYTPCDFSSGWRI